MLALFQHFVQGFKEFMLACAALANFLINSVNSLLQFLGHLPRFITFATTSLNVLPTIIIPFALAAVSMYFVLRLINRNVG